MVLLKGPLQGLFESKGFTCIPEKCLVIWLNSCLWLRLKWCYHCFIIFASRYSQRFVSLRLALNISFASWLLPFKNYGLRIPLGCLNFGLLLLLKFPSWQKLIFLCRGHVHDILSFKLINTVVLLRRMRLFLVCNQLFHIFLSFADGLSEILKVFLSDCRIVNTRLFDKFETSLGTCWGKVEG